MTKVALIILLLIFLGGCASPKITLHIIQDTDIHRMKAGQPYSSPKDGYFLSDFFVKEVMGASVE